MKCLHDEAEKDTFVADGGCPICLASEKDELLNLPQWIFDDGEGGRYRSEINAVLVKSR